MGYGKVLTIEAGVLDVVRPKKSEFDFSNNSEIQRCLNYPMDGGMGVKSNW